MIGNIYFPPIDSIDAVVGELARSGAASFPILDEALRLELLREAEGYTYKPEEEVVGSGENMVRQQMGTCETFPEGSLYLRLRDAFQDWLESQIAVLPEYPFSTRLRFEALSLQRYEAGSIGITPHRDGWRYVNLVCLFVIDGRGRFYVCDDRAGNGSVEFDAAPGNVILMRAPGFLGSNERRFHYVADIQARRYSFGMRQLRE